MSAELFQDIGVYPLHNLLFIRGIHLFNIRSFCLVTKKRNEDEKGKKNKKYLLHSQHSKGCIKTVSLTHLSIVSSYSQSTTKS